MMILKDFVFFFLYKIPNVWQKFYIFLGGDFLKNLGKILTFFDPSSFLCVPFGLVPFSFFFFFFLIVDNSNFF